MNNNELLTGKFNQIRCPQCQSFHFAITVDEKKNLIELKCCRSICNTIFKFDPKLNVWTDRVEE